MAATPPPWSLSRYLLIGLLLRLPAVLFADGYEFLDQQYQYVDPAWHLATGQAWHPTWEWIDGIRSQVYPGMLAGVFVLLGALGFDEPMATMCATRAVHAATTLLPLWLFWLVVVRWRPVERPRGPLLLFAASGLLVGGVQPSGPALATTLAVTAGLAVHGPTRFVFLAGLCLGLAFCCRFQDALFGLGFFGALAWQRRWRAATWFVAGCLPGILVQGFVDLAATGSFLATPWRYVHSNLGLGSAEKWRTQPAWFYLVAGIVPVVVLVPPFLRVAWQRLVAGAVILPAAAAGALVHIAVHSCVARKALRFEYGALALLLAVVAVGVRPAGRLASWHWRCLVLMHAGLWAWASFWFGNAGAVRTALWLREHAAAPGPVVVVDGDATSLGGFFYWRPAADRVVGVLRQDLWQHVSSDPSMPTGFVVTVREPLPADLPAVGRFELAATFAGCLDLRTGERRFVYRWQP